jgi:hypothetical protein
VLFPLCQVIFSNPCIYVFWIVSAAEPCQYRVSAFKSAYTPQTRVEARPTSLTAARYHEPPWQRLIESAGAVLARGRAQGEAVEQVVALIWTAIEQHRL